MTSNRNIKFLNYKLLFCILIFTFIILGVPRASAQTEDERIAELRDQIAELERQAELYRQDIAGESAKADSLSKEIAIIQGQVKKIQTKIYINSAKIDTTEIQIDNAESDITETEKKINYQKYAIGQLLLFLQRRDNESLLATLLKFRSLSGFFRQAQYASTINTDLLDLIEDLKDAKEDLGSQKISLESRKDDLEYLNRQNYYEQLSLNEAKSGKDNLLKITKGQEAQYQDLLKDVEIRKSLFFTELRELETKIIQGGLYLVHIKADTIPPKGKLYRWPEDNYRITQGYGYTQYARRGAYGGAGHNGIDMAAGFGSQVRAIGDGEIVANGFNDGWGNWVAIKHPNSLVSVYGHMSSLSFLRVGTGVTAGEVIGFEGSTGNSTGSHLHLSLYREFFTYVNEKKDQLYFNYFDGSLNPKNYLY